jgi:TolB-like protein/Tfp pilus assembly protein PilF
MDVLVALALRAPSPVSRLQLIDEVWGGAVVTDGVLTRCVAILRERLGDERGMPRFIETLSKQGYRLVPPVTFVDEAQSDASSASIGGARPPVRIAVLPFVNLAAGAVDDHFVDGLTELLIANLAGVAALRVIARTSSMAYKHTSKRVREIVEELSVDYVVEGSVLGEGGRLQVVVQLIEGGSEMHVWAQTFAREVRDALTLLNEVARAVADALHPRMRSAERVRRDEQVALGEKALQHYLKGRYFWAQRGADAVRKAIAEFAACAAEAPRFAPAHVGLADSRFLLALYGIESPIPTADAARAHLATALALDPDLAEAQTALGLIRLFFDRDPEGAEGAFVRALAQNPSYTSAYLGYGDLLMMRGDFERGIALIREAVKLSPFDLGLNMNLGDFMILSRRFDEAVRQFRHTLAMDARFAPAQRGLAVAFALAGRVDDALAEIEVVLAAAPSQPRNRETRAFVLAATGRRDEARRELASLAAERGARYVSAWELARAYAVMGDADDAVAWLRTAIEERAPMTLFAGVHAALDPIRGDARFPEILRALGILPGQR